MDLKKFKHDGQIHVRPLHERDRPMFEHCTNGHYSVTESSYKVHFKEVFHAHKIFCTLIPLNPIYVVRIDDMMRAIEVARVNYEKRPLAFGTSDPDLLKNEILNKPHPDGYLQVPTVMTLLNEVESPKQVSGANCGINWLKNQINKMREARESDE